MVDKLDVSIMPKLGFGLMRLPEKEGHIDIPGVCGMVDAYMQAGFNYFDTAYVYHSGKSETAIRQALVDRYPRNSFMLATKLPAWIMKSMKDSERIFEEQLKRCDVEYFDFYLLHSLEDGPNYEAYVKYDCFSWGARKKAEGRIKHFGFSYHGSPELLDKVLDEHPEIEFVQIQLNYADMDNPVVRSGELYQVLRKHDMPIIVMEPVKGGMLANLSEELTGMMKAARPDASTASWALRFASSLGGVATILSGMSTKEQMEDNLRTFAELKPLTKNEQEVLRMVVQKMRDMQLVQCTSCRYCCEGCPADIKIPEVFRALNTLRMYPSIPFRPKAYYRGVTADSGKASDCIACEQCERVCPQHLHIAELMREAAERLEG